MQSEANTFPLSFEEQIMQPKDKYPSICSNQMEAIVFRMIIVQIFFKTRAVLKIGGEYLISYIP